MLGRHEQHPNHCSSRVLPCRLGGKYASATLLRKSAAIFLLTNKRRDQRDRGTVGDIPVEEVSWEGQANNTSIHNWH